MINAYYIILLFLFAFNDSSCDIYTSVETEDTEPTLEKSLWNSPHWHYSVSSLLTWNKLRY